MTRLTSTVIIEAAPYVRITVTPRRSMKRVILRRSADGELKASAPYGIDTALLTTTLAKLSARLTSTTATKAPRLQPGDVYKYPEGELHVTAGCIPASGITTSHSGYDIRLYIGRDLDINSPAVKSHLRKATLHAAAKLAQKILIPFAETTADSLGITGVDWEIGKATSQLGCCYRTGARIRLSALCLFLPMHLRRFVVCHELAHLTHHNHSADFHALCNRFCDGHESALSKELKQHRWPF